MSLSEDQFFLLKKKLDMNGSLEFPVTTGSMSPLISPGAVVRIAPINEALKKFEILVFYQNSELICHFLHHINQHSTNAKKYVTRPLVAQREDLPISSDEILGVVTNFKLSAWQRFKSLFLS